jgi:hypothetical protein
MAPALKNLARFVALGLATSQELHEELDAATSPAFQADDECAHDDGSCGLSALQMHGLGRRLADPEQAQLEPDQNSSDFGSQAVLNYALNCWEPCNKKAGFCESFCGPGNACCRHGSREDPDECFRATFWPVLSFHTCVAVGEADPHEQSHGKLIPNTPPDVALAYSGMIWPTMTVRGTQEMHILAIGDWGGMDGVVECDANREKKDYHRIIQYKGGDLPGPHTMARTRIGCEFGNLVECFNTQGQIGGDPKTPCTSTCGWTKGVDDVAQILVAEEFKKVAARVRPQYVLNVGDNFYWGGIETDCGTPMGQISPVTRHQFDQIYEGIYSGPGLDDAPWFSVLGNHDWGGRYFNSGWDQQIAYTWNSTRWRMPAPYWIQRVEYPDQGFSADIFMLDSNVFDAKEGDKDPETNICGAAHTPDGANCAAQGGPASLAECRSWFRNFWHRQKRWMERQLAKSKATWQIAVTHFPCGHETLWYYKLRTQYGLDLLVTGHRHQQELWSNSGLMGGLTCVVTGGGGGITSEASPKGVGGDTQYGFFDFVISKEKIKVFLVNYQGKYLQESIVYPKQ